jgi:hypothetical protein
VGAVFRPKDFPMGRKKAIEDAIKDLSPDIRNDVVRVLYSYWKGTGSGEKEEEQKRKLGEILGQEEANRLMKKIGK